MSKSKNSIVEGWNLFERWATNFKANQFRKTTGLLLRDYHEVEYSLFDEGLEPLQELSVDDKKHRIRDQIGFLRGCFVDISFDSGPDDTGQFIRRVRSAICNHNTRSWKKGYGVFFIQNKLEGIPNNGYFGFNGSAANMFCNDLADIDFASAMDVLPFDLMIIRNQNGEDWTKSSVKKAIAYIENDLGRDGYESDFQEYWTNGGFLALYAMDRYWERWEREQKEIDAARRREAKAIKAGKGKKKSFFSYQKYMLPAKTTKGAAALKRRRTIADHRK